MIDDPAPDPDQRRPPGPVPDVVAACRRLLEAAECGEVVAVGVVACHHDRADGTEYVLGGATSPIAQLVLGCERLKARLLAHGEGD